MDIIQKKDILILEKIFLKQIIIYFQWILSSVMNIDIQNKKCGKNDEKRRNKIKLL